MPRTGGRGARGHHRHSGPRQPCLFPDWEWEELSATVLQSRPDEQLELKASGWETPLLLCRVPLGALRTSGSVRPANQRCFKSGGGKLARPPVAGCLVSYYSGEPAEIALSELDARSLADEN